MKKFIFDIDGTLTPSRKPMDISFMALFIIFECKHPVYLVTGSDRQKTIDQVSLDVYNRAKRVYNCSGNDVYEKDINIYRNNWILPHDVEKFLLDELDYSQFRIRTGKHIEYRPGCVNFSIVGRGANFEERDVYKEWDRDEHERLLIAQRFNLEFPQLHAAVGGEIGLDIAPKGNDKGQIIKDFSLDDELHFFGDMMEEGQNDYPLAKAVQNRDGFTYHVKNWEETRTLLEEFSTPSI
tara:strand:+ start:793 stop:1506 length:714 start_codon:yes stop_codon:yes gene_type:complete